MRLINYKMTIQYEGTRYRGWQKQPGVENTIQGKLETLLSRLLNTDIEVYGAGRTDAGVHALGQMASFRVEEDKLRELVSSGAGKDKLIESGSSGAGKDKFSDPGPSSADNRELLRTLLPSQLKETEDDTLFKSLNHYLPDDIAVVRLVRASDRFHARYLASSKWYQYRIRTNPVSDVVNRRFLWQYGEKLDIEKMKKGAEALVGQHDFASFCGLKLKKSTVRTVSRIEITQRDADTVVLDYYGDGFLNHMVRLMTGELVEVGAGRLSAETISGILEQKRKGSADRMAPASGLTLMEVRY